VAVLDWLQQLLGGGDPEAAGAAQASTAMQPGVLAGETALQGLQHYNANPMDAALGFTGGGLGTRLKLGPAEPIDLGRPGFWHNLLDEQGNAAGHVAGWLDGPNAWIESMSGRGGANALGPEEVRGLLRQFRDAYPDVSSIAGERVTGARAGGNQNYFETAPGDVVSVPLRRKQ
jgi:hypothetical protein